MMVTKSTNLWDYISFPSIEERSNMSKIEEIGEIQITPDEFGYTGLTNLEETNPELADYIRLYNNKVVEVSISYAMAIHYFNKRIPDSPFKPSQNRIADINEPNNNGNFGDRFWFGYYSDVFLIQIQTLWDIVLYMINCHYMYSLKQDQRMEKKLLELLKKDHPLLFQKIDSIWKQQLYQRIRGYRVKSTHLTSSINVKYSILRVCFDGKVVARLYGPGEYEKPSTIVKDMEDYISLVKKSVHELLILIKKEAPHA